MSYMFKLCSSLTTLNLSSFNTSKVSDMSGMFSACNQLKTIYASESFTTNNLFRTSSMFDTTPKLIGGNGTTWT